MKKDMNARMSLHTIFDQAALDYDEVRPGYPEELIEDVIFLSPPFPRTQAQSPSRSVDIQ